MSCALPVPVFGARQRHTLSIIIFDSVGDSMAEEGHTLFGYPVPFPREDLVVAVVAVAVFLPVVIIVHTTIAYIISLFAKQKAQ